MFREPWAADQTASRRARWVHAVAPAHTPSAAVTLQPATVAKPSSSGEIRETWPPREVVSSAVKVGTIGLPPLTPKATLATPLW